MIANDNVYAQFIFIALQKLILMRIVLMILYQYAIASEMT